MGDVITFSVDGSLLTGIPQSGVTGLETAASKDFAHRMGQRSLYVALLKTEPNAHPDVRAEWRNKIRELDGDFGGIRS